MSDYADKVESQINQFKDVESIHNHSHMRDYWKRKYISPLLKDVMGIDRSDNLYAKHMRIALDDSEASNILSIGSGDCTQEITIAKELLASGSDSFLFHCHELSPILNKKAQVKIDEQGLSSHFKLVESDLNQWEASVKYCSAMAHHSLHHIVNLEGLFAGVRDSLTENGVFISCDMIGRNGHMRWPEALELVQAFWKIIPEKIRYNHQLSRLENMYINHDCSTEGFEGIRSQDVLKLLNENFHFSRFLGYGNLTDVFLNNSFGQNWNHEDEKDCAFIDFLHLINTILIDSGYLKPTIMMAIMDKKSGPTKSYKHWTPEFCIRKTDIK